MSLSSCDSTARSLSAPSIFSDMQTRPSTPTPMPKPTQPKKTNDNFACMVRPEDVHANSTSTSGPSECRRDLWAVKSKSHIWIVPLLIFAALASSGILVVEMHFSSQEDGRVEEALNVAEETGKRFSDFLDNAMMPLFSLGQFVYELPELHDLPKRIGPVNSEGSLPMNFNSTSHRNVSGVCDDPVLNQRYSTIAGNIKKTAKNLDGVLVNLQLVPEGVVCLLHPVVNTEDFPPGQSLNNTGAIGHDLIADPNRRFHAEESLRQGDLVTVGPIQLVQCQGCDPIVQQAFIARLPIIMEDHDITAFDGTPLPKRWGFAVALINWQVLVEKTHLYQDFDKRGWGFQLTRKDHKFDEDSDSYIITEVVLAETDDFEGMSKDTRGHHIVETRMDTTDNEWEIQVVYSLENSPTWRAVSISGVVFIAALISSLAFIVLLQKEMHSNLVKASLVQAERSARAERDLNDFIAHEIRNPLSAAMSAGTFLATSLEEEQLKMKQRSQPKQTKPLFAIAATQTSEEAKPLVDGDNWSQVHQTMSEDVSIINSSLHFINDLLRNMLDMHRAASRQMVLENSETEIITDVLEPVAAMLQHRDREFTIQIVKDSNVPDPFLIDIDRLRLQQVILNLGRNSAKFIPDGKNSFVRLRAGRHKDGSIVLSVEDSGSGIPASKRDKLFERFQESLDSMSQGTGVGLNLCKTLVELMGGELYLDQTYDSGVEGYPGARFVVHLKSTQVMELPPEEVGFDCVANGNADDLEMGASRDDGPVGAMDEAMSSRRFREEEGILPEKFSILFADDERILRKLATRAFHKLRPEWTVEETATGEAAIQLATEKHYDMIFLDQWFTSAERRLTGTETTRILRAKGVSSIICGCSANDLEDAFLRAGADCFTTKPFDTPTLKLKKFMLNALEKGATR